MHTNYWQEFYDSIRDPSWPDCPNENYVGKLPEHIQQEIRNEHDSGKFLNPTAEDFVEIVYQKPVTNLYKSYPTVELDKQFVLDDDFAVHYSSLCYDAEGKHFGQNLVRAVKYLYPDQQFNTVLDWCSGAGFIGFRMLNDGLCKNVTFVERFAPEVQACWKTVNLMPKRFHTSQIHVFSSVAEINTQQKIDLVVSNPPPPEPSMIGAILGNSEDQTRTALDVDQAAHLDFFNNIQPHLNPGAHIVIQACSYRCSPETYAGYVENTPLQITRMVQERIDPDFYYIEYTYLP